MATKADELHKTQREILAILDEVGPASSRLLVHRLDDDAYRQLVNHHLSRLRDEGFVVYDDDDGLYCVTEDAPISAGDPR